MKKYSPAPFWWTLLLGLLAVAMSVSGWIHPWGPFLWTTGFPDRAMSLFIPILILAEAFLYGRFRRENTYLRLTWIYIVLVALALASAFVLEGVFVLGLPGSVWETLSLQQIGDLLANIIFSQKLFFGVLIFVAHVLFLVIFLKIRAALFAEPPSNPDNLLDDVVP